MTPDLAFAAIRAYCAAKPDVTEEDPWGGGEVVWKTCGKMFAAVGSINQHRFPH